MLRGFASVLLGLAVSSMLPQFAEGADLLVELRDFYPIENPATRALQPPQFLLYKDGTVIYLGQGESGAATLMIANLSKDRVQEVVDLARSLEISLQEPKGEHDMGGVVLRVIDGAGTIHEQAGGRRGQSERTLRGIEYLESFEVESAMRYVPDRMILWRLSRRSARQQDVAQTWPFEKECLDADGVVVEGERAAFLVEVVGTNCGRVQFRSNDSLITFLLSANRRGSDMSRTIDALPGKVELCGLSSSSASGTGELP